MVLTYQLIQYSFPFFKFLQLLPDLEQHYCTHCDRQVLLDQKLLLELYEPGSRLLCPICHGTYKLELIDA